ncbi:MAG: dicarboxylate/amino acid:cation symporter [Prevotellaceae bacterium]|jgi:Na+/H+-dicarboxylate symporter|nr:dicarboxylate/amino acid:cation symporter [Prevotellaceae bacterium]
MRLHWQILIALVAGAGCGTGLPAATPYIAWIGSLFMNALSMLIVPILFFSIVTGIADIQNPGAGLRKLGLKTGAFYLITMLIAAVTGLCMVNLLQPGGSVIIEHTAAISGKMGQSSVANIIAELIPKNIFYAFSQNNTIPVILIAIVTGVCLSRISAEGRSAIRHLIKGGWEITMLATKKVVGFSPIGIFAITMGQFSATEDFFSLIRAMLMYVVTVGVGLCLHTFAWLPLMLRCYKVKPWQHFKNMSTPLLTAFSTASSGATLPTTLYAVEHNDGISSKVTRFTIPLGSAINMDGAALFECVAVIFIAQVYGIELSIFQQMLIVCASLLCAVGSAGIPMAALVMMTVILNIVGLPLEGIGLVVGVDRMLDMMRTAVNVYGDTCVAVMVAKSEGEALSIDR